MATSLA
ncbi:hypothetical protein YPPY06_1506, partial [Yersinia pestis PY-06]